MNDTTSNTPDNASRPGNRNTRPRDEHGRFLSKAEIAERDRQRQIIKDGSTRIGQHVNVERKTAESHTRRNKVKRAKEAEKPIDSRRTMMYQIRTLPNGRGFALYYADGVDSDDPMRKPSDIVKHWLGHNWYQAQDSNVARVFETSDDARKFRREHFSVIAIPDDEAAKAKREARRERMKTLRCVVGNRLSRTEVRRKDNKKRSTGKERQVRKDLVEFYKLIGRD